MRVEISASKDLLEIKLFPDNQIDAAVLEEMGKGDGPVQVTSTIEQGQGLVARKNRRQE